MTTRVSRPLAVAAAIAIVAFGAFAAPAPAAAHWSCGRAAPADIDRTGNHRAYYEAEGYVGSSERCAVSAPEGYLGPNWDLDYHCYTRDIDLPITWTYVVQVGGSYRGWVKDSNLQDHGSGRRCNGDT